MQESTSVIGQNAADAAQYSRRNSDNTSEQGNSGGNVPQNIIPIIGNEAMKTSKIQFANGAQAGGSFYNNSITKKVAKSNGKSIDKKKVLPTKKFPELKLMINGEYRNNNSLSSDDEMSLAVSLLLLHLVPSDQKNKRA